MLNIKEAFLKAQSILTIALNRKENITEAFPKITNDMTIPKTYLFVNPEVYSLMFLLPDIKETEPFTIVFNHSFKQAVVQDIHIVCSAYFKLPYCFDLIEAIKNDLPKV